MEPRGIYFYLGILSMLVIGDRPVFSAENRCLKNLRIESSTNRTITLTWDYMCQYEVKNVLYKIYYEHIEWKACPTGLQVMGNRGIFCHKRAPSWDTSAMEDWVHLKDFMLFSDVSGWRSRCWARKPGSSWRHLCCGFEPAPLFCVSNVYQGIAWVQSPA